MQLVHKLVSMYVISENKMKGHLCDMIVCILMENIHQSIFQHNSLALMRYSSYNGSNIISL